MIVKRIDTPLRCCQDMSCGTNMATILTHRNGPNRILKKNGEIAMIYLFRAVKMAAWFLTGYLIGGVLVHVLYYLSH